MVFKIVPQVGLALMRLMEAAGSSGGAVGGRMASRSVRIEALMADLAESTPPSPDVEVADHTVALRTAR